MKRTIKEEIETEYLKQELINENTLLLYEKKSDNTIMVKMRYIDFNRINELYVTTLTMEEFKSGNTIRINENKTALAVFKNHNDKDLLVDFIDLETHYGECADFMDCAYNSKFKNKVDDNFQLIKKK